MNFAAIALALGAAVFTHTASFRAGNFRVSAAVVGGAPAHLTFAQALQGAEMALGGQVGTVQSGDVTISVEPWS